MKFLNPIVQVVRDHHGMPSQYYTTLPNRETAEKLAALAAAGNVNSHLIGHLKKHHEHDFQSDQTIASNQKETKVSEEDKRKPIQRHEYRQKHHYRRRNKIKEQVKPTVEEV